MPVREEVPQAGGENQSLQDMAKAAFDAGALAVGRSGADVADGPAGSAKSFPMLGRASDYMYANEFDDIEAAGQMRPFPGSKELSGRLTFPGTLGNYLSTDDVNLLDADTAHLQQNIGTWEGRHGSSVGRSDSALESVIGDYVGTAISATGGVFAVTGQIGVPGSGIAVSPGKSYIVSAYQTAEIDSEPVLEVAYLDSSGNVIGSALKEQNPASQLTWIHQVVDAGPAPESAVTIWVQCLFNLSGDTPLPLDTFGYWDAVLVSEGSDPTFVQSLRIVGDLDETIDPPDMPIAFAGDGTPLTIGEGWAGDGYSYIRRDGVGGPIVARFDPIDISMSFIGDEMTFVDIVTGRTWTIHGDDWDDDALEVSRMDMT